MPRRSQRRFSQSVAKSRASSRIERTEYSPARRFDAYFSPDAKLALVARQEFLDEGNKALRRLLLRDKGYVALAHAERSGFGFEGRRRPAPLRKLAQRAQVPRRGVFAFDLRSFPSVKKVRDAVICAKRAVRRELVFASGKAGSSRNVAHRAPPSSVRC